MDRLRNAMRDEALRTATLSEHRRQGYITAYDPNTYSAKVKIMPEGQYADGAEGESGWLPIETKWAGNGWGMFCPPAIGQQVSVDFIEGDAGSGIVTGCVCDAQSAPPNPGALSGEFWLVHKNGQLFKFTNDGKVSLGANSEIDVGNLGNTLHQLVTDAFKNLFNNHVHTNGNGGANTGSPTTQLGSDHLTSVLKAN